jgi:hypothetical protein
MAGETVRINELRLRVPGLSVEQGRCLGQKMAEGLRASLAEHVRREKLGALNLRVTIPPDTPQDQLAAIVARRISQGVK